MSDVFGHRAQVGTRPIWASDLLVVHGYRASARLGGMRNMPARGAGERGKMSEHDRLSGKVEGLRGLFAVMENGRAKGIDITADCWDAVAYVELANASAELAALPPP